jgi:hypothetical protein
MSVHELVPLIYSSHFLSAILLYAGPDQILPLMSVLGGILGVLLVFWQRFVRLARRVGQFFMSKLRPSAGKQ